MITGSHKNTPVVTQLLAGTKERPFTGYFGTYIRVFFQTMQPASKFNLILALLKIYFGDKRMQSPQKKTLVKQGKNWVCFGG